MKYLKKYKIFESGVIPQDMVDDIRDIVIDLEDAGRIKVSLGVQGWKNKKYILFHLNDFFNYDGFLFEEIGYYVFRLKRYLGADFKNCSALLVRDKENFGNRVNIDLTNEEDLIKKFKDDPIENLVIEIK